MKMLKQRMTCNGVIWLCLSWTVGVAHANSSLDRQFLVAQSNAVPIVEKEATASPSPELASSLARLGQLETALKVLNACASQLKPRALNNWRQNLVGLTARRYAVLDERVKAAALLPRTTHPFVRADVCFALVRSNLRDKNHVAAMKWAKAAWNILVEAERNPAKIGEEPNANGFHDGFIYTRKLVEQLQPPPLLSPQAMLKQLSQQQTSNEWAATNLMWDAVRSGKPDLAIRIASIKVKEGNRFNNEAPLVQDFVESNQYNYARAMLQKMGNQIITGQKRATKRDAYWAITWDTIDSATFVAEAYKVLGDSSKWNQWLAFAQKNQAATTKSHIELSIELSIELAPITWLEDRSHDLIAGGYSLLERKKSSSKISLAQRRNIAQKIRNLWPHLHKTERFDALLIVCSSQIEAGDINSAKNALEFLELEKALATAADSDASRNPLLQVASGWRRVGDEEHVQKLLISYIASLEAEQKSNQDVPIIIQSDLETYGFINEAVALYTKHSDGDEKHQLQIPNDWPYRVTEAMGRYPIAPEFPKWIQEVKVTATRQLSMQLYVEQITKPMFDSMEEPNLQLQAKTFFD